MHGTVLIGPDEGRTFAVEGHEFRMPVYVKSPTGVPHMHLRVYKWAKLFHAHGAGMVRAGWVFDHEEGEQ